MLDDSKLQLKIELVPKTSWYSNLCTQIPQHDWDKIRYATYLHNEYKCEICFGRGTKWPVECHEEWEYDDDNFIQTLKGFLCLCPSCHEVKHYGRACATGNKKRAFDHLVNINRISKARAYDHIRKSWSVWEFRSQHDWTLNLDIIKNCDIDITKLLLIRS